MVEGKRPSLVKPSVNSLFHVDFDWWQKTERDWHVYLRTLLCPEHQEAFANVEQVQSIDWVDPVTAEVKLVDGVQNTLMMHCVKQPGFLTAQTALVEAVFRLFFPNGNVPLSSQDLGDKLKRPPATVLHPLVEVPGYNGIR